MESVNKPALSPVGQAVIKFFSERIDQRFTANDVADQLYDLGMVAPDTKLTLINRTVHNLANRGQLQRLHATVSSTNGNKQNLFRAITNAQP